MGRTIPTFRQLIEIEKLDWSIFKKLLPIKKDKQFFDIIFENVYLYASYVGNSVNPIVIESIIMGTIFHNYKTLFQISKENDKIDENSIKERITLLTENKPQGKILFDMTYTKWQGLIDSLHKEDRQLLLKMILEICNYNECCNEIINREDPQSSITYYFFLAALQQQQKLIHRIDKNFNIKSKIDSSLLDFM